MNLFAFYNKYPYPNTQICSTSDLEKLDFQKKLLKIIKKRINKGKILEVGCGTGEMSLLLSKNKYDVTAIDISKKSLDILKKNSQKLKLRIQIKRLNILNQNLKPVYNLSFANGVLHHTENPYLGFCNMVKATKKNGFIFLVLYTKTGLLIRKFIGKVVPYSLINYLFKNKTKSVIQDAFYNPQEVAFSKKDILGWFIKQNVSFVDYKNFGNVFLITGRRN